VLGVQAAPAVDDLALLAELARERRTPELDEGRVRPVAQGEQVGVDALSLWNWVRRRPEDGQPLPMPSGRLAPIFDRATNPKGETMRASRPDDRKAARDV